MTRRIFQHNLKVSPELERLLQKDKPVNPDQLKFKLAKLAAGLDADLHSVECLEFDPYAAKQQRIQLIAETLDQVAQLITSPLPCRVWGCRVDHIGPVVGASRTPDSLRDHGA